MTDHKSSEKDFSNERGIIADNYHELQAIHILERAKHASKLPSGSDESMTRASLQCVEIALLNISDLLRRSVIDIDSKDFASAMVKLTWIKGFHRIIIEITKLINAIPHVSESQSKIQYFSVSESPGFQEFFKSLQYFDQSIFNAVSSGSLSLQSALSNHSIDNNETSIIHLIRICNHESTIWESRLLNIPIYTTHSNYKDYVLTDIIHDAVYDRSIVGDTFFMQFRGLHQIPEVIASDINDIIEKTIKNIRDKDLLYSCINLQLANLASTIILASVPPMVDSLSTADYHKIRENLGLTSGSHSINLHYHLFRDLYTQLSTEVEQYILKEYNNLSNINDIISYIDSNRYINKDAFLQSNLIDNCLHLQQFLQQWRDWHIHLPRNNLGGNHTKSLTGSADAVSTVKRMRESANSKDRMNVFRAARYQNISSHPNEESLTTYFADHHSLDTFISSLTGEVTKIAFQDVQERLGVFATKTPFVPPPRRDV